jgi:hypothetical protein
MKECDIYEDSYQFFARGYNRCLLIALSNKSVEVKDVALKQMYLYQMRMRREFFHYYKTRVVD